MKIESTLTDRAGDTFRVIFNDGDPREGVEKVFFQGVRAFCFCEGKLVVVYADNKKCWAPPGGGIEPGEDYEQAIRREIKEEANMEVVHHELIGYQDVYEPNHISRQTRSFCIVRPYGDFVADPDGDITEIKLIDPTEYKKYFDWTKVGDYLMEESLRRLETYNKLHIN